MANPLEDEIPVRRYSDSEVRLLLERASRLPAARTPGAVRPQGLTLAQLEEIAAEAGIDVAQLRSAARELELESAARPAGTAARLAGAPLRVHAEHTLPFEVSADDLGLLVGSIAAEAGESGKPSLVGRTLTWHAHAVSGRRTEVRVTVHRGATHIRVEDTYGEIAGGLFGGVLGGVGGGVGFGVGGAVASALGSAAVAVALPVAVIAGTYATCRAGFRAYVRRRTRALGALCDRIVHDLTR